MIFTDSFKKDFRFYCEIAFIFSFLIGIGNLLGYWCSLGINIFPFLSLVDLLKCAACPFLVLFMFFILVGGLFAEFSWLRSKSNERISKLSSAPRAYGRWLIVLCLLPFIGYSYGKHKATVILKDKEYSYMWANEKDENDKKSQKELYKYLGFVNEHYFFINKNNRTLIINNDLENLKLYRY